MHVLCHILVFVTLITVSFAYNQGSTLTSRFSKHKNFNLLPGRGTCGIQSLQEKVFGGNATGLDKFPWMALLEYQKNGKNTAFQCGGTLINDKYVLTAAHCSVGLVTLLYGNAFSVRFGEHNLDKDEDCIEYPDGDKICSDPPVNIEIEEIIPHASYDEKSRDKYFDVALVRLKAPVRFTGFIKPICLPLTGEKSRTGEILTVSGWGQTEKGVRSRLKLKADLPVISNRDCAQAYIQDVVINDSQLCAGGQKKIDSCNGDSGGPLMRVFPNQTDYYLEGIVSFGLASCGTENVPGVYTRVDNYIDWILDHIKP